MLIDATGTDPASFARSTGWKLEPQGACRGDVCVPLPAGSFGDDAVDVATVAERLGMPLVAAPEHGVTALGPAARGRALDTVDAPDLELPLVRSDATWRLADQRGRRTVLIAWAPW